MTDLRFCCYPISAIWVVLSSLLLIGCAGLQKAYEPPRVTLANLMVQEAKPLETVFLIELRIINANDVPLEIQAIDCILEINGKPFAAGVSRVEKTVPAYGTDIVPVVVYASVLDTVNRVIGMIRDVHGSQKMQNLEYTLKGKLQLGGIHASALPFDSKGELNLQELSSPAPRGSRHATPPLPSKK